MINHHRVICWFSCGAASAVAAKLAIDKYPDEARIVYCDTLDSEHPDNYRFLRDIQRWIKRPVEIIASKKHRTVDDVFMRERYMSGILGAKCTTELKKVPRFAFQLPDDVHVFGYTADEQKRIERFEGNNPELRLEWILRDEGLSKADCLAMLHEAGIVPPVMYALGFRNNNCLGCVKAQGVTYWQLTREHFPEVYKRRCEQSRELGVRLLKIRGERRFLDELPFSPSKEAIEDVSCGPQCDPNF